MHSSSLENTQFRLDRHGKSATHADYFAAFSDLERVGIVAPRGYEAVGAVALIMAHVTAFYDRQRERGPEFFAYPDYFTFQRTQPCMDYGQFDIWPAHKNVHVPDDAPQTVEAITDRGITILLVPDGPERESEIGPAEIASAQRTIRQCFAYSVEGAVAPHDLVVEFDGPELAQFALDVLGGAPDDTPLDAVGDAWAQSKADGTLRQSFRALTLDAALRRL